MRILQPMKFPSFYKTIHLILSGQVNKWKREMRNTCKMLYGKSGANSVSGKSSYEWKNNMRMIS
jgi:hypothetical protein